MQIVIDDLPKSRGLHSVSAFGHGPVYIYRSMPAGVAQSRRAFVWGTVNTWGRWRIPVNKKAEKASEMPIKHSLLAGNVQIG